MSYEIVAYRRSLGCTTRQAWPNLTLADSNRLLARLINHGWTCARYCIGDTGIHWTARAGEVIRIPEVFRTSAAHGS